ncbi:hypothetical protein BDY24DRAFT_107164 [Mrakia frigida]|uniref:uncharacterized protein n=1 Tax=Mrakia frigida TaxID=29902 RepID=UPI003FCC177F
MAFLVPLLLPPILDATANLALGISNVAQSSSSSISFQVGKHVFSTNKGFPMPYLPYELRSKIILMALEESRALILPPPLLLNPHQPLTERQIANLQARSPLNPANPNYMSLVGERRSANGYPISSWRWLKVSREWWSILRAELWRDCVVGGYESWFNFMLLLDNPDFHALPFVKTLSLLEGYGQPADICSSFLPPLVPLLPRRFSLLIVLLTSFLPDKILLSPSLKNLTSLSLLPTFPIPSSPYSEPPRAFPFGLQLIPPRPKLEIINIGLPIDLVTNEASRQHLARLRPKQLGLTFVRPTVEIFEELERLLGGPRSGGGASREEEEEEEERRRRNGGIEEQRTRTEVLSLRYIPPIDRPLIDPRVFISDALRSFPRIIIYLPRFTTSLRIPYLGDWSPNSPPTSFSQRVVDLVASDNEFCDGRISVWLVGDGLDTGGDERAEEEERRLSRGGRRIWPVVEEGLEERMGGLTMLEKGKGKGKSEVWERQTDLRLFGGLIGVRMESKKH